MNDRGQIQRQRHIIIAVLSLFKENNIVENIVTGHSENIVTTCINNP